MSVYRTARWADTVTVYHREVTKDDKGRTVTNWTRKTAEGVFYSLSKRQTVNGSVLVEHDRHICRIGADALDILERGDVICRGIMAVDVPQNSSPEKVLTDAEHFTADVVSENRQLKLTAHWHASEG